MSIEWVNPPGEKSYQSDRRKRTISMPILRSALNIGIIKRSIITNEFVGATACRLLEFDSQAPFSVAGAERPLCMQHGFVTSWSWSNVKLERHSPGIVHKIKWIAYQEEPIEGSLGTKTLKGLLTSRTCAARTSICILRYVSNHQVVSLFLFTYGLCVVPCCMLYKSPSQQAVLLVSLSFRNCNSLSEYAVFGTLPIFYSYSWLNHGVLEIWWMLTSLEITSS